MVMSARPGGARRQRTPGKGRHGHAIISHRKRPVKEPCILDDDVVEFAKGQRGSVGDAFRDGHPRLGKRPTQISYMRCTAIWTGYGCGLPGLGWCIVKVLVPPRK